MAAVAQDLIKGGERVDAVPVDAGGGGVGVGQVQDPIMLTMPLW